MDHQFDELSKSMAQSFTRRAALKEIDLGLASAGAFILSLSDSRTLIPIRSAFRDVVACRRVN